jgi:hypothetical protein
LLVFRSSLAFRSAPANSPSLIDSRYKSFR